LFRVSLEVTFGLALHAVARDYPCTRHHNPYSIAKVLQGFPHASIWLVPHWRVRPLQIYTKSTAQSRISHDNAKSELVWMKIPSFARKLKSQILRTRVKPYAPSFAEDALVLALRKYAESESYSSAPSHSSDDHRFPACDEDVVAYFKQRRSPSFFADTGTVTAMANRMASDHPGWRDRLLTIAAADRADGLEIYSMTGPPLRPGFPWGGLHPEPNNDDLYPIRPHRFGFAPRHALAVLYGEEPAAVLVDILEDWMAFVTRGTSEFPYCSALVVIQRLLALSWAHAFVMALPGPNDATRLRLHSNILRILHADIGFLLPRLGKSAANNHLLADRFASWYIQLLFPEFVDGAVDLEVCEAAWLAELERQVYPDGTGFEHSLHYHEFGCEMAAAYVLLCRRNSRPIAFATLERIERMLGFQVGLAGPESVTVPFGDATEDPLFGLDTGGGWATAGLRELYRALFRPDLSPAAPTSPSVERAFWLLGGALAPRRSFSNDREDGPWLWPDGGFGVLPDELGSARLLFRTGPAIHQDLVAGHMHADLLSVCVTHGNQAVFTDPGTWCYRWRSSETGPGRAYFSGPAAHNGLALDTVDPLGPVQGDFRKGPIPIRVSTTRCLIGSRFAWLEAEVRGSSPYAGYRRGVVHVAGAYWIIYDRLPPGVEEFSAALSFQTAAGVKTRQDGTGTVLLETSAGTLWLTNGPGLHAPRISQGESDPPGGWVAPSYGALIPATQLRYGVAEGARLTAFALGVGVSAARPIAVSVLKTGLVIKIEGPDTCDLLLLATHDEPVAVDMAGEHGKAEAVWMRTRGEQTELLRCLGFRVSANGENLSPNGVQHTVAKAMFPSVGEQHEVEYREPENLSMAMSGGVWH